MGQGFLGTALVPPLDMIIHFQYNKGNVLKK